MGGLRVVTDVLRLLEVEEDIRVYGKTGAERSDHRFVSEVENRTKMNVVEPPDELHCVVQSSLVSTRLGELLKALPSCRMVVSQCPSSKEFTYGNVPVLVIQ
jgi:hypothetical protein